MGTGAIAEKHAQAYKSIGFQLIACHNRGAQRGREFADRWNAEHVDSVEALCRYPGLDFIDVCSFPNFRLEPLAICAEIGRHVQVQKPMALDLQTARTMVETARKAGIELGVVSQHRFDEPVLFLQRALLAGRLGRLLQADAYVKWFRSEEYYARPVKGSWKGEGGGALINQAIHQIDLLIFLAGPLEAVSACWQLGATHAIESEDIVNALLWYRSKATGVIQASTSFWPGYSERIELHGTKGTAVITGDCLTAWDVQDDSEANSAEPAPLAKEAASGASDPMAIDIGSFERQFLDFAEAIRTGREPLVNGEEGYRALRAVLAIYEACREDRRVRID